MNEVIAGIEAAKADINVMQALKDGDKLLKELRAQATLEDFEKITDDIAEQQAIYDQEVEMFGHVLGEDELLEELESLTQDAIPAPPQNLIEQGTNAIPEPPKNKIEAAEEQDEDEFEGRMR